MGLSFGNNRSRRSVTQAFLKWLVYNLSFANLYNLYNVYVYSLYDIQNDVHALNYSPCDFLPCIVSTAEQLLNIFKKPYESRIHMEFIIHCSEDSQFKVKHNLVLGWFWITQTTPPHPKSYGWSSTTPKNTVPLFYRLKNGCALK